MSRVAGATSLVRREAALLIGIASLLSTALIGTPEQGSHGLLKFAMFVWLFAVILACAFRAIHHAGTLGDRYGEPYGTLVLTLSILMIEVSLIASVMLTGDPDPNLARATMFAGLMLSMNGVVGVVLLAGGLRYGQQEFNLEGARAYLAALIPLAVIALVLPNFTEAKSGTLTVVQTVGISAAIVVFYLIFLAVQTMRHRAFFADSPSHGRYETAAPVDAAARSSVHHFILLVVSLLIIVALAREIGVLVDHGIHRLGMPTALGGVLIAILTLTPESVSAFRAALADKLQHSVNVFLGGAVATIGLTVPCVLAIGLLTDQPVILGLKDSDMLLLLLTLFVGALTFGGVRTNVLQGAVHLLIFFIYLLLIVAP
jgi:Ca2+:H+ antiporter